MAKPYIHTQPDPLATMLKDRTMTISNHGRITIPATIRKKYGLRDGMEVLVLEDEGNLKIVPILPDDEIRKMAVGPAEVDRIYRESKQEERELDET